MPSDLTIEQVSARRRLTVAALFMTGAASLVAATTLMAKVLGQDLLGPPLPGFMVSAGRFLFAWMALVPVILVMRPGFQGTRWRLHAARSVAGWATVTCIFTAAALMPLGDATAISFLNPLIAMVLAIPLLGERVGPWRWGAAGMAVLGALVLIRPGMAAFQPAALIALGAALFGAFEVIFIKMLTGKAEGGGEPAIRILFVNNTIGATVALCVALSVWQWPTPQQWLLLVAIGLVMVTAQSLFIQAMKRADASYVIPFFYAALVFAALYDAAVFGVIPVPLSIAGAALIVTGAIVLVWRERVNRVAES
ncbi:MULTISPECIES: DMT family transporter [Thalassobaculum]|uniref:Threonine/homoserine efflux transporter RhtA n=1 Tax=Thalassobaculum litoreum DSM 18839 TaxID=1123362 RepID=A0A8G2BHA8_9PROT|nr:MULTISPECIES: DMT family transporter [Thalassobaculum]SDF29436.1 Threonine/homoserine efflux transporter RhtA [Thalassobaculum litoreum DSM 18839]